jgi:hypothetical protein
VFERLEQHQLVTNLLELSALPDESGSSTARFAPAAIAGQVVMSIKFGAKPVEFEKGKAGIVVGSKEKLPALIDALIAAVRAGELDDLFSQAAKAGAIGKPKKAA